MRNRFFLFPSPVIARPQGRSNPERKTGSPQTLRVLAMTIVVMILSFPAAADPAPGDSCSLANAYILSGGPENSGKAYLMTCQSSVWVRMIETSTVGYVGIQQAVPVTPLDVGGAVKLGTSAQTCNGTIAGALRWNGGLACVEYCNGTAWGCTSGACDATPTSFDFTDAPNVTTSTLTTSNILSIVGTDSGCSSTVSVSGSGSPQYRVCSDAGCSTEVQTWTSTNLSFAMFNRYLQVRTTSASTNGVAHNVTVTVGGVSNVWTVTTGSAGACGATPTVGQICSDGTVYAGISPDGNKHMYTTRCDQGMSWDGSNCTGTR